MSRNRTGLQRAINEFKTIKEEFWNDVRIPPDSDELNRELEKAGRVADFIEIGELMARDALLREESCGGHFREEYQTEDGEAKRNDGNFMYVSAWEHRVQGSEPIMHREKLEYENIRVQVRDYKH
jgi:succinate dehydrogenase / fumarate reductase flavoprotein subunit